MCVGGLSLRSLTFQSLDSQIFLPGVGGEKQRETVKDSNFILDAVGTFMNSKSGLKDSRTSGLCLELGTVVKG